MYENTTLPRSVRDDICQAVTALLENKRLIMWASNPHNCVAKVALAIKPLVADTVGQYMTEEALADKDVVRFLNGDMMRILEAHAALWLARQTCVIQKLIA